MKNKKKRLKSDKDGKKKEEIKTYVRKERKEERNRGK